MSEHFEPTSFNTSELSSLSSMEDLDLTEVRGDEGRVDPLSSPSDMLLKAKNSYSPLSLEDIFTCSDVEGSSESSWSEKTTFLKVNISHPSLVSSSFSVLPHSFLNLLVLSNLLFLIVFFLFRVRRWGSSRGCLGNCTRSTG